MSERENNFGLDQNANLKQKKILQEIIDRGGATNNADYISYETYKLLFDQINLKGAKIIDMGSGFLPGIEEHGSEYTAALEDKGVTLIPVDIRGLETRSWLLLPREKENDDDSISRPVQANVFSLPFREQSVEGIISVNLFNAIKVKKHLPQLLKEAYRVLKPEGFLIISTFGYYKVTDEMGNSGYNNNFNPDEFITNEDITAASEQIGFKQISQLPINEAKLRDEVDLIREISEKKFQRPVSVQIENPVSLMLKK